VTKTYELRERMREAIKP